MELEKLFSHAQASGMFADYDVAIRGSMQMTFSGGTHVASGAQLFDVASLTKACTHLLFWKMFHLGQIRPDDAFNKFISVPNGPDRLLWHFLCYIARDYPMWSYEALRAGKSESFRETLLQSEFGYWGKRFQYDNISSAYLAFVLERIFGGDLEDILKEQLCDPVGVPTENFLFHPRETLRVVDLSKVVPTADISLRGFVHDPLSFSHQQEKISVAGLFSDAGTLADMFHRTLDPMVGTSFYDAIASNQLEKFGSDRKYALGFDIPYAVSLEKMNVSNPLIFAGWTGCRIFFAEKPRVTICFLTNRIFHESTEESRQRFSQFSWEVIRSVLHMCTS